MASFDLKNFFATYWTYLAGVLFAILVLFFILRGCSPSITPRITYHLGRETKWPSIDLMGKEKNLSAFVDNLVAEIAEKENFGFTLTTGSQNDLFSFLDYQELDGIIVNYQQEPADQKYYSFSNPFFLFGPVLVTPKNSEAGTWGEFKYKIVGIMSQSPLVLQISKDTSIQLKLYDNLLKMLSDLDEHKIDGALLSVIPAYYNIRTFYPNRLKIASEPLTHEGLRLVALKNAKGDELIAKFNAGLEELKKEEIYQNLLDNWGLINSESLITPQHNRLSK